jgi:magnesium transporter
MERTKNIFKDYLNVGNLVELQKLLTLESNEVILEVFRTLTINEQAIVYRLLKKQQAVFIFEHLDLALQNQLLLELVKPEVLEELEDFVDPKDLTTFNEMPAKVVKRMLQLEGTDRELINQLLGYKEETAGTVMTVNYLTLNHELTVNEAFAEIRKKHNELLMMYTLFITNDEKGLLGMITLKELVLALPNNKLKDLIISELISVNTETDEEVVARQIKELDLISMPVVDLENRLVGIITVEEAIDIIDDSATDAILNEAGISDINMMEATRSEILINGGLWRIWRLRVPFLLFTILGGIGAAFLIGGFEERLEEIVALAFFIPIIMDMGGNIGTQSSTIFTRGLVLGHLDINKFGRKALKELLIGLSLGVLVGVITGVLATGATFIWDLNVDWRLGLVVGLALIFTSTLAAILGFVVPWLLVKLKLDQASGTGPIITSIKDVTGLLVYFGLAVLILGNVVAY